MTVNKEHMEQWIAALEAYDREPARHMLLDHKGNMCAVGIGFDTMMPNCLTGKIMEAASAWPTWIGIESLSTDVYDIPLRPDHTGTDSVTEANDRGKQSPWTIAQRLRETYLKDES